MEEQSLVKLLLRIIVLPSEFVMDQIKTMIIYMMHVILMMSAKS